MLCDVHADRFLAHVAAQRDDEADQFEQERGRHAAVEHRRDDAQRLDGNLTRVAREESVRSTGGRRREHSREQRARRSTEPVGRDDIERVIEAELGALARELARLALEVQVREQREALLPVAQRIN